MIDDKDDDESVVVCPAATSRIVAECGSTVGKASCSLFSMLSSQQGSLPSMQRKRMSNTLSKVGDSIKTGIVCLFVEMIV